MDYNKFKNGGNSGESNTFDGDANLNPYAGGVDNGYYTNSPYSAEKNTYLNGTPTKKYVSDSNDPDSSGRTALAAVIVVLFFAFLYFGSSKFFVSNHDSKTSTPVVEESDVIDTTSKYNKDGPATTKEELEKRIRLMLEDGEEDLYVDATRAISEEDVEEVCKSLDLDPFMYDYSGYSYVTSSQQDGDGPEYETDDVGINVQIDLTIEGLVYKSITEGKEIPAENIKASKLKVSCESFLKNNINGTMSEYEKELTIHDYIADNCTYATSIVDGKDEYSAFGVMLNKKAVCEGYSRATALLLKLCNIETKLISGNALEDGKVSDWGHMWNQVKIDGKWYHLDTTWDDPSGTSDIYYSNMNWNDDFMSYDHVWDRSKYESCTSMDANYYVMNGNFFADGEDDAFQAHIREELENGNRSSIVCVVGDVDLSAEALSFILEYDGVESYYLAWAEIKNYTYLYVNINGN